MCTPHARILAVSLGPTPRRCAKANAGSCSGRVRQRVCNGPAEEVKPDTRAHPLLKSTVKAVVYLSPSCSVQIDACMHHKSSVCTSNRILLSNPADTSKIGTNHSITVHGSSDDGTVCTDSAIVCELAQGESTSKRTQWHEPHNRTEQNRTEQNRTEQNRTEQDELHLYSYHGSCCVVGWRFGLCGVSGVCSVRTVRQPRRLRSTASLRYLSWLAKVDDIRRVDGQWLSVHLLSSPTAKVGARLCSGGPIDWVVCLACCVPQVLAVRCMCKSPSMLTSVLIQVTSWRKSSGCEAGCSTLS